MGELLISNVDDAVIEELRRGAVAAGTSMEEEAGRVLTAAVGTQRDAAARRLADIRRRIGRLGGVGSLDELRRDRRRDES